MGLQDEKVILASQKYIVYDTGDAKFSSKSTSFDIIILLQGAAESLQVNLNSCASD